MKENSKSNIVKKPRCGLFIFPKRDLNLEIVSETVGQLAQAFKDLKQPGTIGHADR